MIIFANGWHPDTVVDMAKRLGGKVYRIADCTWIKVPKPRGLSGEKRRVRPSKDGNSTVR